MDCIFCKIINGKVPVDKIYENKQIIAFCDHHPQAPVHQLILPKKHIDTLNDLTVEDSALLGSLIQTASQLAEKAGLAKPGYRLVFNCNADGGQLVFHIHLHLLGGRPLGWPPG